MRFTLNSYFQISSGPATLPPNKEVLNTHTRSTDFSNSERPSKSFTHAIGVDIPKIQQDTLTSQKGEVQALNSEISKMKNNLPTVFQEYEENEIDDDDDLLFEQENDNYDDYDADEF